MNSTLRNRVFGWRRLAAVTATLVFAVTVGVVAPAAPAAASSPQCSAFATGGWPSSQGQFHGSCTNGSSSWSYVIHGACTGPHHGYAVTYGPISTTNSWISTCPKGPFYIGSTSIVLQVAVYPSGTPMPPHPDPNLAILCVGGVCPY